MKIARFMSMVGMALLLPLSPGQEQTIKVNSSLVLVDAQVLSKKTGKTIDGLRQADFLIYENAVLQTITSISRDKLPLSIVLALDLTL